MSLSFNFFGTFDVPTENQNQSGFAGFVGSLMLFMAFFAMAWAALDVDTNLRLVMAYSFILIGGLSLSIAYGFSLRRRTSITKELMAVVLGITVGAIVLLAQMTISYFGVSFSANENVAFALLAPVAETMAFVVAPYHLFMYNFPEGNWMNAAIPGDLIFSLFHFYRYFSRPDVIVIWIILVIGNTLFVYIYHITKNATAAMIAHFVVNLAANSQPVVNYLITTIPLFIALFIVFAFIYYVLLEVRRK